ncbi:MAG TPA: hypothetical protein VKB88_37055 [Bryobacteraceae bacterium]|nr:hypothetical protein [Bryobacteraceae bacterium]
MSTRTLCRTAGLAFAALIAQAQPLGRGFTVDFSQCTEFAGVGPVNFAKAAALVPQAFTTLAVSGTGAIVVRATSCAGASVNGGRSVATTISQIGVEIVPPDGTGDINNYTLIYVSNNAELVLAFNLAGVPALYDPTLTYQFTYESTGNSGELYLAAEGIGLPAYFLTGTETDPTGPGSDFKANWWFAPGGAVVKQASDFPDIAFGTAAVSLHTDRNSALGQLIGGNTDSDFHYLPIRGVYASAHMVVTATGK